MAKGWKPGAISRRLLRKLKKAKTQQYTVEPSVPQSKAKKREEHKPTLKICKVNAEYTVEMQATGENNNEYIPLVYRIGKPNEQKTLAKLERKRQRLVMKEIDDLRGDTYQHPKVCERTCLKCQQKARLSPFDPNSPDRACASTKEPEVSSNSSCDDELSSDCTSMGMDWEIHFTPPIENFRLRK